MSKSKIEKAMSYRRCRRKSNVGGKEQCCQRRRLQRLFHDRNKMALIVSVRRDGVFRLLLVFSGLIAFVDEFFCENMKLRLCNVGLKKKRGFEYVWLLVKK